MCTPSIKTLERAFPGKGKALKNILISDVAVWNNGAVIEWCRQCFNRPKLYEARLEALCDVLGGHGVEYVRRGKNARSPGFNYINMGDTYTVTVVRINGGGYRVTDIGSIIERGNYS